MGRNRKRVAGRAAKRGDAGGKGDPVQAHAPSTMQTTNDAAGPETSGFFDVSTLKTISMSADRVTVASEGDAPVGTQPVAAHVAADGEHHSDDVDSAPGSLVNLTDVAVKAVADGDHHGDNDNAQGKATPRDHAAAPVDAAPVQRAYDLFARLRVWSAASASAERSVILDDPSASISVDAHRDGKHKVESHTERNPQHDTEHDDERLVDSSTGVNGAPIANAALGSCAEGGLAQDEPRVDASSHGECHQRDGAEAGTSDAAALDTATAPSAVCAQTEVSVTNERVSMAPAGDDGHVESGKPDGHGPRSASHCRDTVTATIAPGTDRAASSPKDGSATVRGAVTVPREVTNSVPTADVGPNRKRRTATEVTYGAWVPVDEPGWTTDAISALDAHASRVVAGKPSPRIVVFSHGTAPSALAVVRRFGPDAIVWVVSSAPDARNIERHGCSVVKWPVRAAASPGDNASVRDLAGAVPWHRVDVVVDIGTGRSPGQRARTLAHLVPLMRGSGGIYVCATDCLQTATELLRAGAAAIVHEREQIVVVEPAHRDAQT